MSRLQGKENLAGRIKLNIDFTKLAKLANKKGKLMLSKDMIEYEKQTVKKIPFLLEIKEESEAFRIAVEGGDPNNINKVIQQILKKETGSNEDGSIDYFKVINVVAKIEDGLRHLRNFAKLRRNADLVK
jgi:uncharacterized protein (UPF0216 family)